ncbi:hypothetical protein [Dethiobacter alkaliphilus]|uniref:Uncharacterized protein n=1 Tax=Dethiobacter alkaliphilus AHT 1 TaxID=555088 RepID=C0GDG1_DETAL|nr:hypothetical protein [Dethiobacter alkaliphilus]EEG78682.1 conserved hypothetical protein [Dethiobacter alkaliphilus AHT 1]
MSNITASLLIGRSSTKDGIYATHSMYLIEEEKPVWFLQETGIEQTELNGSCVTWVPRSDSVLEDGLMMIALYVVKNKDFVDLAERYIHGVGGDKADLNADVKKENLEELRNKCRNLNFGKKVAITVLEGSAISGQLPVLEDYRLPVEVCIPQYVRRPKDQGYDYTVTGSLRTQRDMPQLQH